MAEITNKSNHPLRHIVGGEVIDIQPGETRAVADSKELAESVFVKAGYLAYEVSKPQSKRVAAEETKKDE